VGLYLIETFFCGHLLCIFVLLFNNPIHKFVHIFLSTTSCSYDKFQNFNSWRFKKNTSTLRSLKQNPSTSPPLFMDYEVFCLLSLLASWRWYQELHSLYHSICFTYGMLSLLPIPFLNNYEISNFFSQSFNIFQI